MLFILESGMFLMAAIFMGYLGVDALAAHQIAMQWASIAYSIPFSLSIVTALQVGHARGANDFIKTRRLAFHGLILGLVITTIIACIFIFAPDKLVRIFLGKNIKNYQVISQFAISFLFCAAAFQCLDSIQAIANGALRGLKDTLIPMLLSVSCYWLLGISSMYYLAFHTKLKSLGIWLGLTLAISSIGIILLARLIKKLKSEQKHLINMRLD